MMSSALTKANTCFPQSHDLKMADCYKMVILLKKTFVLVLLVQGNIEHLFPEIIYLLFNDILRNKGCKTIIYIVSIREEPGTQVARLRGWVFRHH